MEGTKSTKLNRLVVDYKTGEVLFEGSQLECQAWIFGYAQASEPFEGERALICNCWNERLWEHDATIYDFGTSNYLAIM